MPINRVQFQPGSSMFEFMQRDATRAQCEAALAAARWPDGFVCPRCQGRVVWSFRRGAQAYRECVGCGYQCSLLAGTLLQSSKLPLTVCFMAMQLLSQAKNKVAALELMRQLGMSCPTAWLIKHKLMEAMRLREQDRQLHGRVEIDDAHLGGERSGGKPGRGSENTLPFVLAVQTVGTNDKPPQVCVQQSPFRKEAVAEFCACHMVRPLTAASDGLSCFTAAADAGVHDRIVTGGGRASANAKHPEFQAVNIMLGNLQTAIAGTHHAFRFAKYAPRYLAGLQYRLNRGHRMKEMLPAMLRAILAVQPCPLAAVRAPEVPC